MIVRFYRSTGKAALREMLTPLINNILEQKDLHININPVEVYKQWIVSEKKISQFSRCVLSSFATMK